MRRDHPPSLDDTRGTRGAPRVLPPPEGIGTPARRWTINGDFLGLKAKGVARYAREVTRALDGLIAERHPAADGIVVDLIAPCPPDDALALRRIAVSVLPELRPRLPQVWVQVQLPRRIAGGLLSFCNLAPLAVSRHIACIHDLQTWTTPDSYGRLFRLAHRVILPGLGRRADAVTTVSEFSRRTLAEHGIAAPDRIVVVPNGSDHALLWRPDQAVRSVRGDRPFVLCLGRDEAHKNMRLVWRLAPRLDAMGLDVVVVGGFDAARLDGEGGRPANLRCVGRVDDDGFARAFEEALCFLFPSRIEGFGLPGVEAMARGCPVVAALTPCLTEVYGTAALFAGPDDVDGWCEAVRRLGDDADLRRDLAAKGRVRARRYTWRETALAYLRLMEQVDRRRAASPPPSVASGDPVVQG